MRVDAPQDSPLSYWKGVGSRVWWRTDLASPSPTGSGRCSSIIRAGRPDTHPENSERLQPSSWCCDRKPHSPNGAATNRAAGTGLLGVDTPSYHTGSKITPARALTSHRWASLQLQLSSLSDTSPRAAFTSAHQAALHTSYYAAQKQGRIGWCRGLGEHLLRATACAGAAPQPNYHAQLLSERATHR